MARATDEQEFQTRMGRLEGLLKEIERTADPAVRERTREIVQALLDLHGAGLEKILEGVAATGEAGRAVIDALARDNLVGSLLLLHDLHPLDVEARMHLALEEVRPYLDAHGGNVELLGVRDGVVRLRLHGSGHSCPSSARTMQQTIEEAIYGKAPEVTAVEVEGDAADSWMSENGRPRFALPLV